MDEKPVEPDDKRWANLQKLRKTMGVSALNDVLAFFKPEHKHVAEESRRQQDRRTSLATPDGPKPGFSGKVVISRKKPEH